MNPRLALDETESCGSHPQSATRLAQSSDRVLSKLDASREVSMRGVRREVVEPCRQRGEGHDTGTQAAEVGSMFELVKSQELPIKNHITDNNIMP